MDIKTIALVLLYGLVLQVLRLWANHELDLHHAPSWTYLCTLAALLVLWFGGGNWLYAWLKSRKAK